MNSARKQTPKQYLSGYIRLTAELRGLYEERAQLRQMLYQVGGTGASGGGGRPRGGYVGGAAFEDAVAAVQSADSAIQRRTAQAMAERESIAAAIEQVPDPRHRHLLRLRYICGHGLDHIAISMSYSLRHTIRLHGEALQRVKMT